jgi:hypothetical protein
VIVEVLVGGWVPVIDQVGVKLTVKKDVTVGVVVCVGVEV